jgi:broad specificity phosphatase PhoE
MIKKIYLLRHGEIEQPTERGMIGQTDAPLSRKGNDQAHWQRNFFVSKSIDQIYCSDLVRSMETAQIISQGEIELKVIPGLREINLGTWEGLSREEIDSRYPGAWANRGKDFAGYKPDGGESFEELSSRVIPAFERINGESVEQAIIVGHAGVNRVILHYILGLSLSNIFNFRQDFGSINILGFDGNEYQIELLNLRSDFYVPGLVT